MKYLNKILLRTLMGYLLVTTLSTTTAANATEINEKIILGWVEHIQLLPSKMEAKAKLDTGAKTSSIHARNIEIFDKDGDEWVRFQFADETKYSAKQYRESSGEHIVTIETPLTRRVLIKRHKHTSLERPVVELAFNLGGREYKAEFTLTDRRKFLYPVLLGRRFLSDVAIVDPSTTFLRTSVSGAGDLEEEDDDYDGDESETEEDLEQQDLVSAADQAAPEKNQANDNKKANSTK